MSRHMSLDGLGTGLAGNYLLAVRLMFRAPVLLADSLQVWIMGLRKRIQSG